MTSLSESFASVIESKYAKLGYKQRNQEVLISMTDFSSF